MSGVPLLPVESSMMSHVGYDPQTQTLSILFNSGKLYEYSGVEQQVFDELMQASSKGVYFREEIADTYAYTLVRGRRR